jgi:ribosome-associated toxin RatA of RatAB toxin-antitoxin module
MLLILLYAPFHALARAWQFRNHQNKKHTNIAERILLKEEREKL